MGPGQNLWSYGGTPFVVVAWMGNKIGRTHARQGFVSHSRLWPHSTQYAVRRRMQDAVRRTQDLTRPPPTAHRLVEKIYRYARWSLARGDTGLATALVPSPSPTARARGAGPQRTTSNTTGAVGGQQTSAYTTAHSPIPRLGSRSHGGRLSGNLRLPQGSADCDDLCRARASFPCLVPSFPSCDASGASVSHVASGPSRYHSGVQSSTPSRPKLQ